VKDGPRDHITVFRLISIRTKNSGGGAGSDAERGWMGPRGPPLWNISDSEEARGGDQDGIGLWDHWIHGWMGAIRTERAR
jgi:hypothetical protein